VEHFHAAKETQQLAPEAEAEAGAAKAAPLRDEDAWKLIAVLRAAEATRIPKVVDYVQVPRLSRSSRHCARQQQPQGNAGNAQHGDERDC
jgi:hypothetical protein